MAFDDIERVGPKKVQTVPENGVRVSSRHAQGRGKPTRYISIQIGGGLAKKMVLLGEETALRLQFGSGRDAGKIAMSVDVTSGPFPARKQRSGAYHLTINAASAEGLFALEFPPFTVAEVEVVHRQGVPPMAVFAASETMLAVEE